MSLSTHVLDTAHGIPANGLNIELWSIGSDNNRNLIKEVKTNDDGRTDAPLFTAEETKVGTYELVFHIGDYFRAKGVKLPEPAFIDVVPLRFGISDTESHYHVPLLASPFSFSTYRGS